MLCSGQVYQLTAVSPQQAALRRVTVIMCCSIGTLPFSGVSCCASTACAGLRILTALLDCCRLDEVQPTVVGRAEPHNLCLVHPEQDRTLTIPENARCQVGSSGFIIQFLGRCRAVIEPVAQGAGGSGQLPATCSVSCRVQHYLWRACRVDLLSNPGPPARLRVEESLNPTCCSASRTTLRWWAWRGRSR